MNTSTKCSICRFGASLVLLLGGCSVLPEPTADQTRYFVLTTPMAPAGRPTETKQGGKTVGLLPVELPGYLRSTRSIVVRHGENEISYNDFSRWAESLDSALGRVLKDRLQSAAGIGSVVSPPFPANVARDFDVTIHVIRCEGAVGADHKATAVLAAIFDVSATADGRLLARKTFVAPAAAWHEGDFSQLAELISDAAGQLGSELAASIPQ